jgi:hypothetical protein
MNYANDSQVHFLLNLENTFALFSAKEQRNMERGCHESKPAMLNCYRNAPLRRQRILAFNFLAIAAILTSHFKFHRSTPSLLS